jgi:hypothetical protein
MATPMDKEELLRRAKDPRHIPGIYNYCDRWCERCSLTARCLTFAMEEDDFPKDSEGSAKIALIGIDRSLSAWGELAAQWDGRGAAIGEIVNHLSRLRAMVEKEFPRARDFIRPGFDTPERSVIHDQRN